MKQKKYKFTYGIIRQDDNLNSRDISTDFFDKIRQIKSFLNAEEPILNNQGYKIWFKSLYKWKGNGYKKVNALHALCFI